MKIFTSMLVLFAALVSTLTGQALSEPDQLPSWVLYGLGQQALGDKKFGEATVYFRAAVDRRGLYPEAEAALAQIAGQGDGEALQEAELLKALDERGLLVVPDDKYALLYALADLRLRQDDGHSKEKGEAALETWREILNDDTVYRQVEESGGLDGYYKSLMDVPNIVTLKTATEASLTQNLVGLNKLLYLYRHPLGFSLKAHQEIAALSVRNGAYKKAIGQSLFALTGIFSSVIEEVQAIHPDYVFKTLDELFANPDSEVYLGRPEGVLETSASAGGPNPGWLVRYQPIWDYLRNAGTLESLNTLIEALGGLEKQQSRVGVPPGQRPVKDVVAEIVRWRSLLFPQFKAGISRG